MPSWHVFICVIVVYVDVNTGLRSASSNETSSFIDLEFFQFSILYTVKFYFGLILYMYTLTVSANQIASSAFKSTKFYTVIVTSVTFRWVDLIFLSVIAVFSSLYAFKLMAHKISFYVIHCLRSIKTKILFVAWMYIYVTGLSS